MLDRKLTDVLSRRQLLKETASQVGLIALAAAVSAEAKNVTEFIHPSYKEAHYPDFHWWESSFASLDQKKAPALIELDGGHKNYVKAQVHHNPVAKEITRRSLQAFYSHTDAPKPGDLLYTFAEITKQTLHDECGLNVSFDNIAFGLLLTNCAIQSPYLSVADYERMGIKDAVIPPGGFTVQDTDIFQRVVPKIKPFPKTDCLSPEDIRARCDGGDRAVHGAGFAAMHGLSILAEEHSLVSLKRVPFLLRANILAMESMRLSPQWESRYLVGLASAGNEVIETFDAIPAFINGKKFRSGFIDDKFDYDIWANLMGRTCAEKILAPPRNWGNIETAARFLNDMENLPRKKLIMEIF